MNSGIYPLAGVRLQFGLTAQIISAQGKALGVFAYRCMRSERVIYSH